MKYDKELYLDSGIYGFDEEGVIKIYNKILKGIRKRKYNIDSTPVFE